MSKITEGPWTVKPSRGTNNYCVWAKEEVRRGVAIGVLVATANEEGDARAIAALPDLIAAAEPIVQELDRKTALRNEYSLPTDDPIALDIKLLRALRSALLKAKGEAK